MSFRETAEQFLGGPGATQQRLSEELKTERWQTALLAENLNSLERTMMEDPDWRRLGSQMEADFSRTGLDTIISVSRAMYLANPLIQRGVNVTTYYTWAQGVEYTAEEERIQKEIVDPHIENEGNRLELYGHQARILTDIDQMTEGNVALALFTDPNGDVNMRSIPIDEIREIITHPQDRNQVWFYVRCWAQREFDPSSGSVTVKNYEALYPDIRYQPRSKPETIGGRDVFWDAPVIHQRTGGLKKMQFGVPQTYAALDWARAYKRFLEDWHTIVASLATFAWRASTKSSKVDQLKRKLGARRRGNELEEQPSGERPPAPGSIFVGGPDDAMVPINKSGAATSAEDAKASRLMVASALDLPDTMLSGDPQQGNLATAKSLDRPTELGMNFRRMMWNDFDARIFRYIVDAKVRRGRLPGRVIRTPDGSEVEPGIDPTVSLTFPPILEQDMGETVNAIVAAATLAGKTDAGTIPREEVSRLLMTTIGVENVEDALDDLDQEQQDALTQAIDKLNKALAPGEPPNQNPNTPAPAGAGNGGPPR